MMNLTNALNYFESGCCIAFSTQSLPSSMALMITCWAAMISKYFRKQFCEFPSVLKTVYKVWKAVLAERFFSFEGAGPSGPSHKNWDTTLTRVRVSNHLAKQSFILTNEKVAHACEGRGFGLFLVMWRYTYFFTNFTPTMSIFVSSYEKMWGSLLYIRC